MKKKYNILIRSPKKIQIKKIFNNLNYYMNQTSYFDYFITCVCFNNKIRDNQIKCLIKKKYYNCRRRRNYYYE